MTDIVERLRNANDRLLMAGNDYSDVFLDAADEIERLRQRVAELENAVTLHKEAAKNIALDAEKELAALKAGQGEPVAWGRYWDGELDLRIERPIFESEFYFPLYTSAPTIPEGYISIDLPIIDGWIAEAYADDFRKAMLAAAPKP